jgi:hypothetical protein
MSESQQASRAPSSEASSRRSRRIRGQNAPLHGEGHFAKRSSRLGSRYQADIPENPGASENRIQGRLVWAPSKIQNEHTQRFLGQLADRFAQQVHFRDKLPGEFHDPAAFSSEKALYLLHSMDYNVDRALLELEPRVILGKNQKIVVEPPQKHAALDEGTDEEDLCFICKQSSGQLLICDSTGCRKVYHIECLKLEAVPRGKWSCPRHKCSVCPAKAPTHLQCVNCSLSFCDQHVPQNLLKDYLVPMFLCGACSKGVLKAIRQVSMFSGPSSKRQFMMHLSQFYKKLTQIELREPTIAKKKLDFYLLYKYVINLGGCKEVTDRNLWDVIGWLLEFPQNLKNVGHHLNQHYLYVLKRYEDA